MLHIMYRTLSGTSCPPLHCASFQGVKQTQFNDNDDDDDDDDGDDGVTGDDEVMMPYWVPPQNGETQLAFCLLASICWRKLPEISSGSFQKRNDVEQFKMLNILYSNHSQ